MPTSTALKNASPAEFQAIIDVRRQARMARIDAMPSDVRECVHLYGLCVVDTLRDMGITKARHIKHIVETILNEFSPTRGSGSAQGTRSWRDE